MPYIGDRVCMEPYIGQGLQMLSRYYKHGAHKVHKLPGTALLGGTEYPLSSFSLAYCINALFHNNSDHVSLVEGALCEPYAVAVHAIKVDAFLKSPK